AGSAPLPVQSFRVGDCQGDDKRNPRFRTRAGIGMTSSAVQRGIVLVLLILQLSLAIIPPARANEATIKIGILHSLSGTMAISEAVLKDTVPMLIEDQNQKGGLLGRKME